MIKGSRVMILTIDEGGVPPHIKPLIASIVSAIGNGNWGEVTHSLGTAQELEEAQGILEEAEAAVHDAKQAGWDLVEEVKFFCSSIEVVAVSTALKKAYEAVSDQGSEHGMDDDDTTELLEQVDQTEKDFVIAVKKLNTYANGESKHFEE